MIYKKIIMGIRKTENVFFLNLETSKDREIIVCKKLKKNIDRIIVYLIFTCIFHY